MPPRRLIRWKSFWLGILVLGFLAFGWVRSIQHTDHILIQEPPDKVYEVGVRCGVFFADEVSSMIPVSFAVSSRSGPYLGELEEKWALLNDDALRWRKLVAFPIWFPMLLFVVPWVGFLAWRWRRQRKLTA
jgi:hypothetical protein